MARANSIILTKEDKKAKLAELNENIKLVKSTIKGNAADVKDSIKRLATATKEHATELKTLNKEADKLAKDLALLEAQKSALVNDPTLGAKPVAKPTSVLDGAVKRTRRTKAEMEAARAAAA